MENKNIPLVIVAAGKGTRLDGKTRGLPKCLTEVVGVPIIERILKTALSVGITRAIIVVGYRADVLKKALGNGSRLEIKIDFVENLEFHRGNGLSALLGAKKALEMSDSFLLSMSDHLVSPEILTKAIEQESDKTFLMVDSDIGGIFDLPDATKVRLENAVPTAIGKDLAEFDTIDTGIFSGNYEFVVALEGAIAEGKESISDAILGLIVRGRFEVVPIPPGASWIDIDTPAAFAEAERRMREGKIKT